MRTQKLTTNSFKAANIMIHEKGELQIIDFGVAGVLPTKLDKRSTMIGSLHWMPPEMHLKNPGLKYGTEVRLSGFRVRERGVIV